MTIFVPDQRSARRGVSTELIWVRLLLAGTGSDSTAPTVTTFVKMPGSAVEPVMLTVADAPETIGPKLAVITPRLLSTEPWLELARTRLNPAGSVSVNTTAVALAGPPFATVKT